jgi:hypothetical protein
MSSISIYSSIASSHRSSQATSPDVMFRSYIGNSFNVDLYEYGTPLSDQLLGELRMLKYFLEFHVVYLLSRLMSALQIPIQASFSSENWGEKRCIRIPVAFRLYLVKIIQILTN